MIVKYHLVTLLYLVGVGNIGDMADDYPYPSPRLRDILPCYVWFYDFIDFIYCAVRDLVYYVQQRPCLFFCTMDIQFVVLYSSAWLACTAGPFDNPMVRSGRDTFALSIYTAMRMIYEPRCL